MAHCINISHPQYKKLKAQSGLIDSQLQARISIWRDTKNKPDDFPDLFSITNGRVDPNVRSKYFESGKEQKVSDVLDKIAKSNHPLSVVAKQLQKYETINKDVPILLLPIDFIPVGIKDKAAGVYNPGKNTVEIAEFAKFQGAGVENTIIHEIIHAYTVNALTINTQATSMFKTLYEHAKQHIPNDLYAMKDIDEFIVGLFTDSKFIIALSEAPPYQGEKFQNLWQELLDTILSLLGFTKDERDETAYTQAFALATNIFKEAENYAKLEEEYAEMLAAQDAERRSVEEKKEKYTVDSILKKLTIKGVSRKHKSQDFPNSILVTQNGYIKAVQAVSNLRKEMGINNTNSPYFNTIRVKPSVRKKGGGGRTIYYIAVDPDLLNKYNNRNPQQGQLFDLIAQNDVQYEYEIPLNKVDKSFNNAYAVLPILNKLSAQYNIPFKIVKNLRYNNRALTGRAHGRTVYIDVDRVHADTPLHEFLHFFIKTLKSENPALFNSLVEQMLATKEGKEIFRITEMNHDTVFTTAREEALVEYLGKVGSGQLVASPSGWEQAKIMFRQFLNWLGRTLNTAFGVEIEPSALNPNTTILEVLVRLDNAHKIKTKDAVFANQTATDNATFNAARDGANAKQDETITSLEEMHSQLSIYKDYYRKGDKKVASLTNIQMNNTFFDNAKISDETLKAREWGAQSIKIFTDVLLDKSLKDIKENIKDLVLEESFFSEAAIESAYYSFVDFVNREKDKGNVIVSEVRMYAENTENGDVGTTINAIVIDKEGLATPVKIYTSPLSSQETEFINKKKGKGSFRDYIRYRLSAQVGIVASSQIPHSNRGLLLPIKIVYKDDINTNTVDSFTLETPVNYDIDEETSKDYVNVEGTAQEEFDKGSNLSQTIFFLKKTIKGELQSIRDSKDLSLAEKRQRLNKLLQLLEGADKTQALIDFIEDISDFIKGNTAKGIPSFRADVLDMLDKMKEGNLEDITKILTYKDMAETFHILLDRAEEYHIGLKNNNVPDQDALMEQLAGTIVQLKSAIKLIEDNLLPSVAEYLSEESSGIDMLNDEIKKTKDKIKEAQGKEKRRLERHLDKLIASGPTKQNILQMLKNGALFDLGFFDALLNSPINQPNALFSSFVKRYKNKHNKEFRQPAFKIANDISRVIDEYAKATGKNKDFVSSFYEPFLSEFTVRVREEDKNGKKVWVNKMVKSFIQETDYAAYTAAKTAYWNQTEAYNSSARYLLRKQWVIKHTEVIPFDDEFITHPETGEKVLKKAGIHTLMIDKLESIKSGFRNMDYTYKRDTGEVVIYEVTQTPDGPKKRVTNESDAALEWKAWIEKNAPVRNGVRRYGEMFREPLLKDERFKNMSKDQRKLYDTLIFHLFKSQEGYPKFRGRNARYMLPSVRKSFKHRFAQNGAVDAIREEIDGMFNMQAGQDELLYVEQKGVPVLFDSMIDPNDVSLDLGFSVSMHASQSLKYNMLTKLAPLGEFVKDSLRKKNPLKRDAQSNKIINGIAKAVGIQGWDKYEKVMGDSQAYKAFNTFMEMMFYGMKRRETRILWGKVSATKLTNAIVSYASRTQIALNIPLSIAEYLNSSTQTLSEAFGEEHFNKENLANASKFYAANMGDLMIDMANDRPRTLIGQLFDLYGVRTDMNENFSEGLGQTTGNRTLDMDSLFFNMRFADIASSGQLLLSLMDAETIEDENGNKIKLIDAYEMGEDGMIVLKKGIDPDNIVNEKVYNKLAYLNKRNRGTMAAMDKPAIEQENWGQLVMMYRRYVVPGIKKRFKSPAFDIEADTITEGTYVTWLTHNLSRIAQLIPKLASKYPTRELTSYQKANVRRAAVELTAIWSSALLASLLIAMVDDMDFDDDEDKELYYYPALLVYRMNLELSFFGGGLNPMDAWRTLKTPTIAYTSFEKWVRLVQQFFHPFETYERKSGIWDKGDSKLAADFIKVLGITGYNWQPMEAMKVMSMHEGKQLRNTIEYDISAAVLGVEND